MAPNAKTVRMRIATITENSTNL